VKGKVKSFLVRKGWGFIIGDDGNEYFCHHSDIIDDQPYKILITNQIVEFEAERTSKGLKAVNIRPTDGVTEEVEDDREKDCIR